MNIRARFFFVKPILLLASGVIGLHLSAAHTEAATTLFNENFNGYTYFPNQVPSGDYVNKGIPEISEGAAELWFGARFEAPSDGSIDSDLFVQRYGDSFDGTGPGNQTPTGRFEDDAGLVLRIDTSGFSGITLSFDWRTFQAETSDRVVVGYYVGELGFDTGANRYKDLQTGSGVWSQWTELMRDGPSSFQHEVFTLTAADNAGPVYVAFWMDDGEGDYGKLDNVLITGNPILIPEPTTLSLALVGIVALVARRKSQP